MRVESEILVHLSTPAKRAATVFHGCTAEQLIKGQTLLDALLVTVEPRSDASEPSAHEGEEILYMLDGELDVRLGNGQRFKVKPGESLFYPSTVAHEWANPRPEPARFLWVATPPTY